MMACLHRVPSPFSWAWARVYGPDSIDLPGDVQRGGGGGSEPLITLFYIQWTFDFIVSFPLHVCNGTIRRRARRNNRTSRTPTTRTSPRQTIDATNNDYDFLIVEHPRLSCTHTIRAHPWSLGVLYVIECELPIKSS